MARPQHSNGSKTGSKKAGASPKVNFTGVVKHITGNPVAKLTVTVYQKLFRDKRALGRNITTKNGHFSIPVTRLPKGAICFIDVTDSRNRNLTSSGPIFNPRETVVLNLVVRQSELKGLPAFELRKQHLNKYWVTLNNKKNRRPLTIEDVEIVAGQTGLDPSDTYHWLRAHDLEKLTGIPSDTFYGLFKGGFPTGTVAMSKVKASQMRIMLKAAVDGNFIVDKAGDDFQNVIRKWTEFSVEQTLKSKVFRNGATLGNILGMAIKDEGMQRDLLAAYSLHEGTTQELNNTLKSIAKDPSIISRLEDVLKVGAVSGNQPEVMQAMLDKKKGKADILHSLSAMREADWVNLLGALSKSKEHSVVPVFVKGKNEKERISKYAQAITRNLAKKFPTQSFFGKLETLKGKDEVKLFKSTKNLQTFFRNNPEFDLKNTSIVSLSDFNLNGIKDDKPLLEDLQSAKRLTSITDNFEAIIRLKSDGLDSSTRIVGMTASEFKNRYAKVLGSEAEATELYRVAEKTFMEATIMATSVHGSQAVTMAPLSGPVADPTLRTLFGSLDTCDCEECASIYSPAAYFADILNFLYKRAPNVYHELTRRRRDLIHIKCNCKNANTPQPYTDLVNELLERFVLTHKSPPDTTLPDSYQTTWEAAELATNPEHINYSAYDELKAAVYPAPLPFNLPVEETRTYLRHLGIQKHQLMSTFFRGTQADAFNDFDVCMEYLGFTYQEARVLSGEPLDTNARPGLWKFYGFNLDTGFKPLVDPVDSSRQIAGGLWSQALTSRVDVFLQQTSLSYKELLSLLLCDAINPSVNGARVISIQTIDVNGDLCDTSNMSLAGVQNTHLEKIHRFVRLWKKLGWTLFDLDKASLAFNLDFRTGTSTLATDPAILSNRSALIRIAQSKQLSERLDLPLEQALVLWSPISTTTYTDFSAADNPPINSLYNQLFSSKAVLNPVDPAFADPLTLSGNLSNHIPTLLAAFQISQENYGDLVPVDLPLTLGNLSEIYRNVLLAKCLKLGIRDFLSLKSLLTPTQPFQTPFASAVFLSKAEKVTASGFTIHELNFLLKHEYREATGVAPTDERISNFLSELRGSLRAIERSTPAEQRNTIVQKFSEKLMISAESTRLLMQTHVLGIEKPTLPIVDDFRDSDFSTSAFLMLRTNSGGNSFEPEFVRASTASNSSKVAVGGLFNDFVRLEKIATVIRRLKLSDAEVEAFLLYHATMGLTNLATLPVTAASSSGFDAFERILDFVMARDMMPPGTPDLVDIAKRALLANGKNLWLAGLAQRTNWNRSTLEWLVGDISTSSSTSQGILNKTWPTHFTNGGIILQIQDCIHTLSRIGLSPATVGAAIAPDFTYTVSDSIKNAAKAKYSESQWLKLAKPLKDDLREKQREALVAYVVVNSNFDPASSQFERWKDKNELYDYLLVDPEMKPINMIARLKLAISSVQLMIDRVTQNQERPNCDPANAPLTLPPDVLKEWNTWRNRYRVRQANLEILLRPENYLDGSLRDDKSPLFRELESRLRQGELTEENVEDAFYSYLTGLDEIARLEIVGQYRQVESGNPQENNIDILHVFGRTSSSPHKFFHRMLKDNEWTPWTKLEIDIDGNHIVPFVFNRRIYLFWLFFVKESEESSTLNPNANIPAPRCRWKIQLAWSEFRRNKWTAKKMSRSYGLSDYEENSASDTTRSRHYLMAVQNNSNLRLEVFKYSSRAFAFIFTGDADPAVDTTLSSGLFQGLRFTWRDPQDQMLVGFSPEYLALQSVDYTMNDSIASTPILGKAVEGIFRLVMPADVPPPLWSHIPQTFFFQDFKNTFMVNHARVFVGVLTPQVYSLQQWVFDSDTAWPDQWETIDVKDEMDIDRYFANARTKNTRSPQSVTANTSTSASSGAVVATGPTGTAIGAVATTYYFVQTDSFTFSTFFHPHVKTFMSTLYKKGVEGLINRQVQTQPDAVEFAQVYGMTAAHPVITPYPKGEVDFSYGSAYGLYNWELFFHVPMLIFSKLFEDQRHDLALKWIHLVFNPTTAEGGGKERFWQFKPFYEEALNPIQTLNDLLRNHTELEKQVDKWMSNPFKPHVIARMRISAYMKHVVMRYLDLKIAKGDLLYKQDTIETINLAVPNYLVCAKILGERPQAIPPRARHVDMSFEELNAQNLDPITNALVQIESLISPSAASGTSTGNSASLGQMFYFCIPRNEQLLKYWDIIANRLFNIRHSMNIEGVVRTLPLYEPCIDPMLMAKAAAAGMDLSSILSDVHSVSPQQRFAFTYAKAMEACQAVLPINAALLQALEKRDAEAIALLRLQHELHLQNAVLAIKEKQVEDARAQLDSAKKAKEIVLIKHQYYSSRTFMNKFEKQHLDSLQVGMIFSIIQGELSSMGGLLAAIPNLKVGSPTSVGATWGGDNLGAVMNAVSTYMGIYAAINTAQGTMASTLGSYTRRMEDWTFQSSSAKTEIEQQEKMVVAAEIKLAIAEDELKNHHQTIAQSTELDEKMRTKFTNQELYEWHIGQLSTLLFQGFQLTYDLAKKAQQCFWREIPAATRPTFIQFGYWDSLKKGLLSAEKLQYDLRRMESSYHDQRARGPELTKHISIMLLNPAAILELRKTGIMTFIVPEEIFDLDYPGHYFRKIKSVSLTIPCMSGPYTTINATLRQMTHTTRLTTNTPTGNYATDSSTFRHIATQSGSMATSSGQNDSGMFELNFQDERYFHFEDNGVFGQWQLELMQEPALRMIDYNSISDVILTIKYTSKVDEGPFKARSVNHLKSLLRNTTEPTTVMGGLSLKRLFSLKNEFGTEWNKFLFPPGTGADQLFTIQIKRDKFPFIVGNRQLSVSRIELLLNTTKTTDYKAIISGTLSGTVAQASEITLAPNPTYSNSQSGEWTASTPGFDVRNLDILKPLTIKLRSAGASSFHEISTEPAELLDMFMVVHYSLV